MARKDDYDAQRLNRKHVPGSVVPFLVREFIGDVKQAAAVWLVLWLHCNRERMCWPNNKTLVEETGFSLAAIQRHKETLERMGWLENLGQRGGWKSNCYKVSIGIPKEIDRLIQEILQIAGENITAVSFDFEEYENDRLLWLVAWRVVNCLKFRHNWKRNQPLPKSLRVAVADDILMVLLSASPNLSKSLGRWWLWGDGFNEEAKRLWDDAGA